MPKVFIKKRYFGLAAVLTIFVLIALAPFLVSSSSALHFFVSSVNKNFPGRLSIDSWLIGWQQGVLCKNVIYQNPDRGIDISIPTLTSNRGLLELFLTPENLGVIQAESPLVRLSGQEVNAFFVQGREKTTEAGENIQTDKKAPFWDQLVFELKTRDGHVTIGWEDEDSSISFRDISFDSSLAAGVAKFAVDFQTIDQGFVEASGSFSLPAHAQGWLDTIVAETEMKVESLQLENFLSVGREVLPDFPQGRGILDADIRLKSVGFAGIDITGLAEVTDVRLNGGLLDEDQPSFQKIHLAIDQGNWTERGWSVKRLELVSDTIDMELQADFSSGTKRLQTSGTVTLPVLFDQFPRLLHINEKTFVESGIFDFVIDIESTQALQKIKLKTKADNIGGVFQGHQFVWESPGAFLFNGEKDAEGVRVSALQLEAPFARAKASGDLHSFAMDAEMDVQKALAEIGTLFQLDLTGSGEMELMMKSSPEGNEGQFKVDTEIVINDLMLQYHDKQIIPLHQLSLTGLLTVPKTFFTQYTGELAFQLGFSSWLGEVDFAAHGNRKKREGFSGYFATDSELNLAQITPLLHTAGFIEKDTRVSGKTKLHVNGFVRDLLTEIREFSAVATDFSLEANGAAIADPVIQIKILQPLNKEVPFLTVSDLKIAENRDTFFRYGMGLNLFDFSTNNITVHDVSIEAGTNSARVKRLVIPDWQKPFHDAQAQVSLSADLNKLTQGFYVMGLIPGDTAFSGYSNITFFLADQDESTLEASLDIQIDDFAMKRRNKTYIDSNSVTFSSRVNGLIPFGEMIVEDIKLRSDVLKIDALGKVTPAGENQLLELSGEFSLLMENIGSLIRNEWNYNLEMQGHSEELFDLRYPLWGKPVEEIDGFGISSTLRSERIVLNGIELSDVDMPFYFDNNLLHTELSGAMNEGRISFASDTDFTESPPVIKTTGSNQVMTGVKLSDPIVKELISRFHPLFGGLADSSGKIDARLDSFWFPLGDERADEANFVVIFSVGDVQIIASRQLKEILELFALDKENLEFKDSEIYCIGKNGGIKCSPVRIQAGDAEVVVSGTVFMDRSVEYTVEMPITRKLVDREGYKDLEGLMIRVALQGTTMDPMFDRNSVKSSINGLMEQGADETRKSRENTE